MPNLHPDSGYLAEYSAGGMTPGQCVSISAHLHFCATCRDHVASLEEIGGVLLEQAQAVEVDANALENLFERLESSKPVAHRASQTRDAELSRLPEIVRRLIPAGAAWRRLSPSVRIARIPIGENRFELALHKIKPGGNAPEHDHEGVEITVVLQGSFSDDNGIYQPGDFVVRQPGDIHQPMATQQDQCICLSVCEAPIRLVGPFKRWLNPFISFKPA